MTLPQPKPPHSALPHIKPHLSPPRQLTSSSSLSPTPSPSNSSTSFRSSSETYVNDLGGPCIPDPNWPARISRNDAYRVYDSTDDEHDEHDSLQSPLRKHVLEILDTVDVGVYDEWALQADDALSIEELQEHADHITRAIHSEKPVTKRRPRFRNSNSGSDEDIRGHIPVMDMMESESLEMDEKENGWKLLRGGKHTSIQTLPDDDLSDIMIADDAQVPKSRTVERKRGHRRIETLDDGFGDEFDTGQGMRDVPIGVPSLPGGKRGHRRIETLDDGFDGGFDTGQGMHDIPIGVSSLPNGKRGHRRIETLDDGFDTAEEIRDIPSGIPPFPPGKRGHPRIETLSDGTSTPISKGHNRVETLDEVDLCEPPALKRVETLPDEPLDTPVLNGVQRMGFEDVMSIPIPPPLPSPIGTDDTPRGTVNSDVETTDGSGIARIDSLSEDDTLETSLDRRREKRDKESGRATCSKLPELCRRIGEVTRCLADVQMITASHAASAEASFPRTNNSSTRDEISHLRITVDHLARLILERAYKTSDVINCHTNDKTT